MKKLILSFITLSTLSVTVGFAQGLLLPREMTAVRQTSNSGEITGQLRSKGYQKGHSWKPNETDSLEEWHFKTVLGEQTDFTLRKVSKAENSSFFYYISNAFYYQQFVGLLKQEKYPYSGVKIIDNICYNSFSDGRSTFLTLETKSADNKIIYEVRLE